MLLLWCLFEVLIIEHFSGQSMYACTIQVEMLSLFRLILQIASGEICTRLIDSIHSKCKLINQKCIQNVARENIIFHVKYDYFFFRGGKGQFQVTLIKGKFRVINPFATKPRSVNENTI